MTKRGPSFEGELSTQAALSEHLANRALDAYLAGDNDAFRYASEIHDETWTRIEQIEAVRNSIHKAFENLRNGEGSLVQAFGALAIGGVVLTNKLEVAQL